MKFLLTCLLGVSALFAQTTTISGSRTVPGGINICSESGSGNVYSCAMPSGSTIATYAAGVSYTFVATHTNTGSATLSIDGLSAIPINGTSAANAITSGTAYVVTYNGTTFDVPLLANPTTIHGLPVEEYSNSSDPTLATFLASLHDSTYQVTNILVFGDSISICWQNEGACGTTGPVHGSSLWTNALRTYVQSIYGSHGTGLIPLVNGMTGGTNSSAIDTTIYGMAGSYSFSNILGPYQDSGMAPAASGSGLVQLNSGATVTMSSQTGDHVNIYCATYTNSSAGLAINIDGTSVGTACNTNTGSALAHLVSFAAPSGLGSHIVTITSNGTSGYLYGVEWTIGSTGVSVHNMSVGGAVSGWFGAHTAQDLAFSDLISGHHLSIFMLGTNEPGNGSSVATYTTNMQQAMTHELTFSPSPSLLVINEPPSTSISGLSSYWAAGLSLARANSSAFLSIPDRWGTASYAASMGLLNSDGIHPSDKGQLDIVSMVENRLIYNNSTGGGGSASPSSPFLVTSPSIAVVGAVTTGSGASVAKIKTNITEANWIGWGSGNFNYSGKISLDDVTTGSDHLRILYDTSTGTVGIGGNMDDGTFTNAAALFDTTGNVTIKNLTVTGSTTGISGSGSGLLPRPPYLYDGTNYYVASTGFQATRPISGSGWGWETSDSATIAFGTNGSMLLTNSGTANVYYGHTGSTTVESELQMSQFCQSMSCPFSETQDGIYIKDAGRAYFLTVYGQGASSTTPATPSPRLVFGSYDLGDGNGTLFYAFSLPPLGLQHLKMVDSGGTITASYSADGGQTFTVLGTHGMGTFQNAGIFASPGTTATVFSLSVQ